MKQVHNIIGFTYVRTKLMGLSTTVVYFRGSHHETRKEYQCCECLEDVELVYKPDIPEHEEIKLNRLKESCLCAGCYDSFQRPEVTLH